jgi:hypothetical protein
MSALTVVITSVIFTSIVFSIIDVTIRTIKDMYENILLFIGFGTPRSIIDDYASASLYTIVAFDLLHFKGFIDGIRSDGFEFALVSNLVIYMFLTFSVQLSLFAVIYDRYSKGAFVSYALLFASWLMLHRDD